MRTQGNEVLGGGWVTRRSGRCSYRVYTRQGAKHAGDRAQFCRCGSGADTRRAEQFGVASSLLRVWDGGQVDSETEGAHLSLGVRVCSIHSYVNPAVLMRRADIQIRTQLSHRATRPYGTTLAASCARQRHPWLPFRTSRVCMPTRTVQRKSTTSWTLLPVRTPTCPACRRWSSLQLCGRWRQASR